MPLKRLQRGDDIELEGASYIVVASFSYEEDARKLARGYPGRIWRLLERRWLVLRKAPLPSFSDEEEDQDEW